MVQRRSSLVFEYAYFPEYADNLVFFISFVWPRLYEEKKGEIDTLVATAVTTIQKQAGPLFSKLPPQVQKLLNPKAAKQD